MAAKSNCQSSHWPSTFTCSPSPRKRSAPRLSLPHQQPPEKRLKTNPTIAASSCSPTASTDPSASAAGVPRASAQVQATSRNKAERWFHDTNEHPRELAFIDNDPPFYMNNLDLADQTDDHNSVNAVQSPNSTHHASHIGPTAPTYSLLAQMNADNGSNDDFRSVIDDLTIQNKKLKKKLKKYETLHCSHLDGEKLFEVRIHGLAASRKRQLEETLRSFASTVDEDDILPQDTSHRGSSRSRSRKPIVSLHKETSVATSHSKPQDSTYASMSGRTGISVPQHERPPPDPRSQASRPHLRSPLHVTPESLAPRLQPLTMSDRSKTKLVVRRLEQLFTGKSGTCDAKHRRRQPHELSHSSLQLDRRKTEPPGQRALPEGVRQAHILWDEADLRVDTMEEICGNMAQAEASTGGSRPLSIQESGVGSPRSPEQRPTRPADLDLRQAQDPSDTIEYIRHLGLTSEAEGRMQEAETDDGWVYLNLLTGMAQLHTLNVTPDFVRKAVTNVSHKLEMSADGTKVRWLGGNDGTRMSSDGDDSADNMSWKPSVQSSRTRSQASKDEAPGGDLRVDFSMESSDIAPEAGAKRRPIDLAKSRTEASRFQYRPLFFHTAMSNESDESCEVSDSSDLSESPEGTTAIASGTNALHYRQEKLRGRRRDRGPIIFYNRAKFCTDLSGDPVGADMKETLYLRLSEQPLGCSPDSSVNNEEKSASNDHEASSGSQSSCEDVTMEGSPLKASAFDLEDLRSTISECSLAQTLPSAMEATGLGGVHPDDHFVVKVAMRYGPGCIKARKPKPTSQRSRSILHDIAANFHSDKALRGPLEASSIAGEIISTKKMDLPPSTLPPPSYICLPFTSSSSDEEDDEYEYEYKNEDEVKREEGQIRQKIASSSGNSDNDDIRVKSTVHSSIGSNLDLNNDRNLTSATNFTIISDPESGSEPSSSPSASPSPRSSLLSPRLPTNPAPAHYRIGLRPKADNSSTHSSEEEESSDDDDDDDDDESSSIDLLATARDLDPDTIAAREREFEFAQQQQQQQATLASAAASARLTPRNGRAVNDDSESDSDNEEESSEDESNFDSMSVDGERISALAHNDDDTDYDEEDGGRDSDASNV